MLQASYLSVKVYRIWHMNQYFVPNNLHVVHCFVFCLCFNATIITHTVPKRTKSTNIWMSISLPLHVVQWFPFRQIWKDEARKLRKSGSRQGGENIMFNMRNSFKCLWGQICKRFLKGGCIIKKDSDFKTLLEPMPFPKLELTSHLFHLGKREDFQHHLR